MSEQSDHTSLNSATRTFGHLAIQIEGWKDLLSQIPLGGIGRSLSEAEEEEEKRQRDRRTEMHNVAYCRNGRI